jgi:lysyl-tRNA synthetase, class II
MLKNYPKEVRDRIEKIEKLRDMGHNPYPDKVERSHKIQEFVIQTDFDKIDNEAVVNKPASDVSLVGRIMFFRDFGKLAFAKIQDDTAAVQICFKKDVLGEQSYKLAVKLYDLGDFVAVKGQGFTTNKGEHSLMVAEHMIACKAIKPLPEKFHGMADEELILRKKYLDCITSQDSFMRIKKRINMIKTLRRFLEDNDFLEIETPVLCPTASGALAKPFTTHHQALDHEFYLKIAPETSLKKAVCAGFDRVYEFSKCFRNEGIDPTHLQEFTMLEFYASYWNYEDGMKFQEDMISNLLEEINGGLKVQYQGVELDFTAPYKRVSLRELILKDADIDIDLYDTNKDLAAAIHEKGIKIEDIDKLGRGNLIDQLYKKVSRPKIIQPIFLTGHPLDLSPLSRTSDTNPKMVDRFQLVAHGAELSNNFSELIDPVDQMQRFMQQAQARQEGDQEALMFDYSFLEAMQQGFPPMCGFGIGIDRLIAFLLDLENIKDTLLFPLMKPSREEVKVMQELGQGPE